MAHHELDLTSSAQELPNHHAYSRDTFGNEYQSHRTSIHSSHQQGKSLDDQWQIVIDWVNQFNNQYCLLVCSKEDFQSGVALCHLVGQVVCSDSE